MNAQLHFRKAEYWFGVLDDQPVVACHGKFESAAERETVDDGHRGTTERLQIVEYLLTKANEFKSFVCILDACELIDVGTHNKAVVFSGVNNDTGKRWFVDCLQDSGQLFEHRR